MKLTSSVIKKISNIKNEPEWMREFRLKSFLYFKECKEPNFGPKLKIDYDKIYLKSGGGAVFSWL